MHRLLVPEPGRRVQVRRHPELRVHVRVRNELVRVPRPVPEVEACVGVHLVEEPVEVQPVRQVDPVHLHDADQNVLIEEPSSRRIGRRQHNLCVESTAGLSRSAAKLEKDRFPRLLGLEQRILIAVVPGQFVLRRKREGQGSGQHSDRSEHAKHL